MANEGEKKKTNVTSEIPLKEIVNSSYFVDLAIDSEVVLDQLLTDGFLRELPVIGIVVNMIKLGIDVRNRLFLEKLLRFCNHLQDVPEKEKQRFTSKLQADEEFRRRVGENLVLLLDRLDDVQQKPNLLGRIFRAYMEGTIDCLTFQKLSTAVDRIKIYNTQGLINFYTPDRELPDDETLQDLAMCGLVSIMVVKGLAIGPTNGYAKNELGKLFIEIALDESA